MNPPWRTLKAPAKKNDRMQVCMPKDPGEYMNAARMCVCPIKLYLMMCIVAPSERQ